MAGVTGDLASRAQLDVSPVFGGAREGPGKTTHGCPGYEIAMAVLLGLLTAVLDADLLAPGSGLLTVRASKP
jgi:hypothetical protein